MAFLRFSAGLLLLLLSSTVAFGHGFSLNLVGNQLTTSTDLFVHDMTFLDPEYSTNHGLFSKSGSPTTPWTAGDSFRFDIVSPLFYFYSGVDSAAPAPGGVTMSANHTQSPFQVIEFDGLDADGEAGFPVSATSSHHMQWVLSDPGLNLGAYGFKYRISGFKGGDTNQPYDPTDVMLIFDTPGADYGAFDLAYAQAALYGALESYDSQAVPEPSTAVAVLLGLGVTAVIARRRLAKKRKAA